PSQAIDPEALFARAVAVLRRNPSIAVLVRADKAVDYGAVVGAMVLLQKAGAGKVGLSTQAPKDREG
ncbi:MAG: biopolymer transporter ExbD, partial [Pseudomonadota bacterium]|nr:biopolymer transporter ExbD [Pseudomonadota bacterium]